MGRRLRCPHCGAPTGRFDQPRLTVDAVVENDVGDVLLIKRKNPPLAWALPGGFVDVGETLETAVTRELREETGLSATALTQLYTYSNPERDPRHHTVSTVFLVAAEGEPQAGDDALQADFYAVGATPPLAFDHARILEDVQRFRKDGTRPDPSPRAI